MIILPFIVLSLCYWHFWLTEPRLASRYKYYTVFHALTALVLTCAVMWLIQ